MLPLSEYLLHRDLVVVLIQPGQKRFEMVCRDPLPKKKQQEDICAEPPKCTFREILECSHVHVVTCQGQLLYGHRLHLVV
jgi:hypothetical protein